MFGIFMGRKGTAFITVAQWEKNLKETANQTRKAAEKKQKDKDSAQRLREETARKLQEEKEATEKKLKQEVKVHALKEAAIVLIEKEEDSSNEVVLESAREPEALPELADASLARLESKVNDVPNAQEIENNAEEDGWYEVGIDDEDNDSFSVKSYDEVDEASSIPCQVLGEAPLQNEFAT